MDGFIPIGPGHLQEGLARRGRHPKHLVGRARGPDFGKGGTTSQDRGGLSPPFEARPEGGRGPFDGERDPENVEVSGLLAAGEMCGCHLLAVSIRARVTPFPKHLEGPVVGTFFPARGKEIGEPL